MQRPAGLSVWNEEIGGSGRLQRSESEAVLKALLRALDQDKETVDARRVNLRREVDNASPTKVTHEKLDQLRQYERLVASDTATLLTARAASLNTSIGDSPQGHTRKRIRGATGQGGRKQQKRRDTGRDHLLASPISQLAHSADQLLPAHLDAIDPSKVTCSMCGKEMESRHALREHEVAHLLNTQTGGGTRSPPAKPGYTPHGYTVGAVVSRARTTVASKTQSRMLAREAPLSSPISSPDIGPHRTLAESKMELHQAIMSGPWVPPLDAGDPRSRPPDPLSQRGIMNFMWTNALSNVTTYVCDMCGAVSSTQAGFIEHYRAHVNTQLWINASHHASTTAPPPPTHPLPLSSVNPPPSRLPPAAPVTAPQQLQFPPTLPFTVPVPVAAGLYLADVAKTVCEMLSLGAAGQSGSGEYGVLCEADLRRMQFLKLIVAKLVGLAPQCCVRVVHPSSFRVLLSVIMARIPAGRLFVSKGALTFVESSIANAQSDPAVVHPAFHEPTTLQQQLVERAELPASPDRARASAQALVKEVCAALKYMGTIGSASS